MYARIKTLIFHLAKLMGLFALARRITRRGLRILCYHSFSTDSDAAHRFRPGTFMRPQTFRRRIDVLARMKLPVLPLHDALNRLRDGTLPPCAVAGKLGNRLGVPYDEIVGGRVFSIMTADEIREAVRAGIDIQLHAHRHRLPDDPEAARREIRENRAVLEPLVAQPPPAGNVAQAPPAGSVALLRHFCYPSGVWNAGHFAALRDVGILSATTCEAGLNYAHTPPLALRRFLDGEQVSDIEFEAELSGFSELLRRVFRRQAS